MSRPGNWPDPDHDDPGPGWQVRKAARALNPGDRFIFTEELGGEGETLTVISAVSYNGISEILTEELEFRIEVLSSQWLCLM